MTDKKKTDELNEAELDQVTGGASIGAGGERAGKSKIDKIVAQAGDGEI